MKLAWIHYLRIFAALGVVLIHASADSVFKYSSTPKMIWQVANLCNASARWTVPAFVMISGYLLLEPGFEGTLDFYRRRLKKLLVPSAIAILGFSLVSVAQSGVVSDSGHRLAFQFNADMLLSAAWMVAKNIATGFPFYHLWYLYMILGLFLLTPLFRRIVSALSVKSLGILCASLLGITIIMNLYLGLVRHWGTMYIIDGTPFPLWFVPYLGYYFCGYFFRAVTFRPAKWILVLIFVGSVTGTAGLCSYFTAINHPNTGLFFYSFTGITVVPMTLSIFLFFQGCQFQENFILETMGNLTFGIYLIHPLFQMALSVIGLLSVLEQSVIGIPVIALLVFTSSALVIYVLLQLIDRVGLKRPMEERITLSVDERTSLF